MKRIIIFIFLTSVIVAGCSGGRSQSAPVQNINVDEYRLLLEDNQAVFINTHIPFAGDIPDTDLSIPFDEIENHLDQITDKNAPIVLYCRSGNMSSMAAKTLLDLGYTDVSNLVGGMNAWVEAGYELDQ